MLCTTRFILGCSVIFGASATDPLARHHPEATASAAHELEEDDDEVSLVALKFAVASVASLERRKARAFSSIPVNVTDFKGVVIFAARHEETVDPHPSFRQADEPAHRGRFPLPFQIFSLLASSSAVIFVGCNDLLWFFPFAMHSRRWQFVALYILVKEFFAGFSWFVVAFGQQLENLHPGWPVDHVLNIACPTLLALYAFVLFLEWHQDVNDTSDAADARESGALTKSPRHPELPMAAGSDQRLDLAKLGALSIIGSLDNLAVFIPGIEEGSFNGPQVAICTLFSSVFVVVACIGAGRIRSVARLIEAVPLWCILAAMALWYSFRLVFDGKQSRALF